MRPFARYHTARDSAGRDADVRGHLADRKHPAQAAALEAIKELETALNATFQRHPDAEILRSMPGLGMILGAARVLGEFDDDPALMSAAPRLPAAGCQKSVTCPDLDVHVIR